MSQEQNVSEMPMQQGSLQGNGSDGDEGQTGSNVPHGMGQSKSSRRRRRKRKNKGPEGVAINGQAEDGGAPESNAAVQGGTERGEPRAAVQRAGQGAQSFQGSGSQQAGAQQGGQQQNGSSGKRWKKKFRDRDRQRQAEPGNQASGSSNGSTGGGFRDANSHQPGNGGGFKRKGGGGGGRQQRGPRSFVGPMDHSYRVVNGNFLEAPPSTIETHGNYQGRGNGGGRGYQSDSQPIDYSQGRVVPIAADAQTKIFFFIEDLFFLAKIQETAKKIGVKVAFVKNEKDAIAELTGGEEEDRPALIVFDLNNANAKPLTLIPKLKAKLKRSTSIIGFLSHLQGDLKAKAMEAGCDTVMPRAAFSQNLPNLLRRYGIEDEEEGNFNQ